MSQFSRMQVRSPQIVPDVVMQCSYVLPATVVSSDAEPWAAVELPASLRHAVAKRQRHFRAGRYCAIEALRLLGAGVHGLTVGRSATGAPVWPAGVTGSITHTDDFVSAAAAWSADVAAVGIDTERLVPADRARDLSCAVATGDEMAEAQRAGCDVSQAFTLLFSAKEAVFKCLYGRVGRLFGFHDVRLVWVEASGGFYGRLATRLAPTLPAGTTLAGRFEIEAAHVHTGVTLRAGRPTW